MKRISIVLVIITFVSCSKDDMESFEDIRMEEQEHEEEEEPPLEGLNALFNNCLISDKHDNITRKQPIEITAYDPSKHRIKTNYKKLKQLLIEGTDGESWFITQGSEASTIVEITKVDIESGWISIGETYLGKLNATVGARLEFFNPFVNYEIINKAPLFNPYPKNVVEGDFNYIQAGGLMEKSDGSYVLLTPVIFGTHTKRSIYFATSTDLEKWNFHNKKLLGTETIPFAKPKGNVFSSGNPLKLENGTFLVLLGVEQPNGNYTSAYMVIDENLNIVQSPKEIMIDSWNGLDQNGFPLSIIKFDGRYRIMLHRRHPNFIDREIHEIIIDDLFNALDHGKSIVSSTMIHKGVNSTGYLRGKADDVAYIIYDSELYIFIAGEEVSSGYLTSRNRQYGLAHWSGGTWVHDKRSPILVNPVQLYNKYPVYDWAWDHLGTFLSPIVKDDHLYMFTAFGTDNPDYYITGIKVPFL
ncbi:hypothetical protein [Flagellimonas onchidii]|uniref:hypothetical protein n=1 Tax=Flagellimonas onchidii TaxID=2562684 RepID=UPI0010A65591|nr:hypothetical protein [Allomuricauda onchidii]